MFQFLGYITEAFVFAYLGLTFFSYTEFKWSPHLFFSELLVIMVGRVGGTVGLVYLFVFIFGFKWELGFKKLIFIWYAGMIRGAIAFGLVLRISNGSSPNRGVIVTTSLLLVIFTTVVFGSTVGLLQNCLMGSADKDEVIEEVTAQNVENKDEEGSPMKHPNAINDNEENSCNSYDESSSEDAEDNDNYEHMVHPNEENASTQGPLNGTKKKSKSEKKKYTGCSKYLHRFDELIMKPIFIYNYERNMQKKSKEFFNLFMK